MAVSIKEVASRSGVSVGTVSNVINRPDQVSDQTLSRVRAVIAETGYVPNGSAQQLRAGSSPMVAVIVPDIANPFFAELVRGVEQRAVENDLAVFVCATEFDLRREERYLGVVLNQRPRGVLLTPSGDIEPPLAALGGRLSAILIDRTGDDSICSVAVDDFRGGGLAVRHLFDLGHRSIAWVVGPDSIPQCAERTAGVRYAADRLGVAIVEVGVSEMTLAAGKRAVGSLDAELPSAVMCANDLLALGVEFELLATGVAIPDRVSVVGFDDIEFGAGAAVTLTSVARPAYAMGVAALEMLLDEEDEDGHVHRQVQFQPKLTVRDSTAPPHAT